MRRALLAVVVVLAASCWFAGVANAAQLGFDELPAGTVVQDQYAKSGLKLGSPTDVGFPRSIAGCAAPTVRNSAGVAQSAPNYLQLHQCAPGDLGSISTLWGAFTNYDRRLVVVFARALPTTSGAIDVTLTAFDAQGNSIHAQTRSISGSGWTPLFVFDTSQSIRYFELLRNGGTQVAVDDLGFDDAPPPLATTEPAQNVTGSSADLEGNVNPQGYRGTAYFQYGLSSAYGLHTVPVPIAGGGGPLTQPVGALQGATTYHYRVVATNPAGTTYGGDQSFTTPATSYSVITGGADTSKPGQALAQLTYDAPGGGFAAGLLSSEVGFEYGISQEYGKIVSAGSITGAATGAERSAVLGALSPSTTYHYRAYAKTPQGTIFGQDRTFTTNGATGQLAYRCPGYGICVVNDDGTHSHLVAREGARDSIGDLIQYYNPRWSPDGTQIAFQESNGNVGIVPADGGAIRSVPTLSGSTAFGQIAGLAWSPDGNRLYVTVSEASLFFSAGIPYMVDVHSGTAQRLSNLGLYSRFGWQGGAWWPQPIKRNGADQDRIYTSTDWCAELAVPGAPPGPTGAPILPTGCGAPVLALNSASAPGGDAEPLYLPTQDELSTDEALDPANNAVFFARGGQIQVVSAAPPALAKPSGTPLSNAGWPTLQSSNPVTPVGPAGYSDAHPTVGGEGLFFDSPEIRPGDRGSASQRQIWEMGQDGSDRRLFLANASDPDWLSIPPCDPSLCGSGYRTCPPLICNNPRTKPNENNLTWGEKQVSISGPYQNQIATLTNTSQQSVQFQVPSVTGLGFAVVVSAGASAVSKKRLPDCRRLKLAPHHSCKVVVRFDHRVPGIVVGALAFHESGNPTAAVRLIGHGSGFAPLVRSARILRRHRRLRVAYRLTAKARALIEVSPAMPCPRRGRGHFYCPAGPPLLTVKTKLGGSGNVLIPTRKRGRRLPAGRYVVTVLAIARHWTSPPINYLAIQIKAVG